MGTYQIACPIIKSSNDYGYSAAIAADYYGYIYRTPSAKGTTLFVAGRPVNSSKTRMGIAWDDSDVPTNKRIVRAELHYYGLSAHGNTVYYRYADFAEGSAIPTHEPSDGSISGGARTGWNVLDLGKPKGNSIILYADLGTYQCPVYNPGGGFAGYATCFESWEFYSQRSSANQPYILIIYEDIPPDPPTGLYPNGGTVSTRDGVRFTWKHNSKEGLAQKGFVLQYSINGGSWTTISQTTSDQFCELEPNILPASGTVTWRVKTIDTNDTESEYSSATFTLGILPQKAPIPVSPVSQYVMEGESVRFEWVFSGGSDKDYQAKFVLQYSTDNGVTWTTVEQTSGNTYYMLAAGFVKGNVLWQVKTYNQWDDESPYSDIKTFTVIGIPAVPLITEVTNRARPTIKWQTQEQQLFELEIANGEVIYATGIIPGNSVREYDVPIYLDNGTYTVRLRVINEHSLYSDWAEKAFTISVEKPAKPSIIVYNSAYKVTIKTDSILRALVYRDGTKIGEMDNGLYEDCTGANKTEYRYFIRVIDGNDSFADSDIKIGKCVMHTNTIALLDNPGDYVKLEHGLDGIPEKKGSLNIQASTVYYDGRKYPVTEYAEFEEEAKTMAFFFEQKKDVDKLKEFIVKRKPLIYRDVDGEVIIGKVTTLDYNKTILGYEIGFTITRCEP